MENFINDLNFSRVDLVSFDIFDTLLHRSVLAPVDVFKLVCLRAFEDPRSLLNHQYLDNFLSTRMLAEAKARAYRVADHGDEGEILIDEIYDQWREETGAESELADWLKELELECEARLLYASKEGKAAYNAARASGCKVFFVSDMYLPSAFLREVLISEGFEGAADVPLYVSGEVRLSKHMGTLYGHVAKMEGHAPKPNWLHVGDNQHSDVVKAREAGLTAHHATWADIRNVPTVRPGAHGSGNFVHSLMLGLKEPQARGRLPVAPLERIGYQIWGPMLFGFSCWLIAQFRQTKIDHAIFMARDGWIIQQLINICITRLPETSMSSEYFYMSRKTGYKTGVRNWDPRLTWYYVPNKGPATARRIFSAVGLDAADYKTLLQEHGIHDIEMPLPKSRKPDAVNALNRVYMDVLKSAANNRKDLAPFYDAAMAKHARVALVDIGWAGNIQRCFLHSLSDPAASAKVFGFYFGLHRDHILNADLGMSMQGWLNGHDKYDDLHHALISGGIELMEFIMSAPHGSTLDLAVDKNGISPVLEELGSEEKEYQSLAAQAQAGVFRFVEDHAFLLEWLSPDTLSNPAWADIFLTMVNDPDDEALTYLSEITHSEGIGANNNRLVLAAKMEGMAAFNPETRRRSRKAAFWKAAFDKLNPPISQRVSDLLCNVIGNR